MNDQTPPQPPDGCVYGPWWDAQTECWVYLDDGLLIHYWNGRSWQSACDHSRAHAELLRIAAERDELRAEVEKKDRFIERWKVEVDDLQAEIERLQAEQLQMAATIAHLHAGTMPTWKDLKGPAK